ncbi:recombinase family protein [Sinorhizobium meliloti]|uniref:recombinase family protein n=1 Tax=Rhizobium meliloti TaxID=382 RepID=UPI00244DD354|nr:recombinase family protein [Sinorhizobium meliloti]WGI74535.1 recombinase family protein [Sinorhizobium meliloti]
MTLVAYIRVSSVGQSLEVQRDKMLAAGAQPDHIFEEKRSGVDANRPALKEALRFARKGDTFVITKIDRLARSAADLLSIVKELQGKGVELRVLDQSIDTSNPAGRAMLQMLGVFAEFETAIRAERQMDGIAKAKADGTKFGRKPQATPDVVADIRRMRAEGLMIREIMEKVGLSKASVYRALGGEGPERPGPVIADGRTLLR